MASNYSRVEPIVTSMSMTIDGVGIGNRNG
jgi:hypothetical protein